MNLCARFGVVVLSGVTAAAEPETTQIQKDLAAWVQTYAASQKSFQGSPSRYYPDATKTAEGQLNGEAAAAIVFTLEGIRAGNDYLQYLGLFWKRGVHYALCCSRQIGGKGIRSVEEVSFAGDTIRLSGKEYVPGTDPMCCPSKPYIAEIRVQDAQLVDVQASNNRWSGP